MAHEPQTSRLWLVPDLDDPGIREDPARPARFPIAGIHVEPYDEDAHVRPGIFAEKVLLRPPGAGYTSGSRGGQEQDQANVPLAGIEPVAYFANPAKMRERGLRERYPREQQGERKRRGGDARTRNQASHGVISQS